MIAVRQIQLIKFTGKLLLYSVLSGVSLSRVLCWSICSILNHRSGFIKEHYHGPLHSIEQAIISFINNYKVETSINSSLSDIGNYGPEWLVGIEKIPSFDVCSSRRLNHLSRLIYGKHFFNILICQ